MREETDGVVFSIKIAAHERRQISRKIIHEKTVTNRAKNASLWNTARTPKGASFVILKYHTSAPIRKKRLSPMSKARRKTIRNKYMKTSGRPDRVECLRKVHCSKSRSRTPPEFTQPIRNELRKKQSLIYLPVRKLEERQWS